MIFSIKNNIKPLRLLLSLGLVLGITLFSTNELRAQCETQVSGIIAEWNFDAEASACALGESSTTPVFAPGLSESRYCPNVSGGCGDIYLGSNGHANTAFFQNGICLLNFYDIASSSTLYGGGTDYDPNSTTFDPNSSVNLYLNYTMPQGGGGCIDNFSIVPVQYMYDGSTVNFESMGMAVYRNGFLIHTETQNIAASNVNGTPMNFVLNGSQFCADGSQEVVFEIRFGLINQLVVGGASSPAQTGVDDIQLTGNCSIPSSVGGFVLPGTCLADGSVDNNGQLKISGFEPTDRFDFTGTAAYTGSATYATATPIPVDGILATNLVNPVGVDTMYTVRVINDEDCSLDLTLRAFSVTCLIPCDQPNSETISSTDATCAGLVSNDDGTISISGVVDGDRIGIFAGGPYAGPDYASADVLVGGGFTYTALPNPVSNQIYTIRIYNGAEDCYVDRTAEIFEFSCGPCSNATAEVMEANEDDSDSTPGNSDQTEDDIAVYEACKSDLFVDLELSKTVSPTSGTTADTYIYTLTLNNTGTMTATDIQVAENFPTSVAPTVLTGTLGTTPDSLTITASSATIGTYGLSSGWQLDSLQAGQSATLTIDVRAMIPGTYDNCAYVTNMFPDNDPDSVDSNDETANEDDDDCATITVTGAALPSIVKEFSPMLTIPNTPTRLTLKITNSEAIPITLTSDLTDIFPTSPGQMEIAATPNLLTNLSGITVNAGDVQVLIPSGTTLPVGLSQIQFDIIVPAEGHYCNDIAAGDLQTSSGNNLLPSQACLAAYNAYVLAPVTCVTDLCITTPNGVDTLVLTIENRNATPMTLDQDFINYLPDGVTMAAGSNTGTLTGVVPFTAGDTSFVFVTGSTIPPGVQTIIVPVTSATAGCYNNIINMNAILVTVGGFSDVGNQDIAEPKIICDKPVITAIDTSICNGQAVDLITRFTTTGGTLTYHSALPPTVGNELASTTVMATTDSTFYALATDGLCFDTLGVLITMNAPPTASPVATNVCTGSTVNVDGVPAGGSGTYTTHTWTDLGTGTATGHSLTNPNAQIVTIDATAATAGTIDLQYIVTDDAGCSATATVTIQSEVCIMCTLTSGGQTAETCNDNATNPTSADDYITFSLNPTGMDLDATYSLSVDNGGTVTLAAGGVATGVAYGNAIDFRLQDGSADGTTTYTITITDDADNTCMVTTSLMQTGCSNCPSGNCGGMTSVRN